MQEMPSDSELHSPNYNFELLSDLRANTNNENLMANLNTKGVREALQLFKLWLHKRGLYKGLGSFNSFIASMFVMNLITTEQINSVMNEYQIFRTILLKLSEANWHISGQSLKLKNKDLNLEESLAKKQKSNDFDFLDFHKHFDVVFSDESGYLNICSNMMLSTFLKVKHEAVNSLKLLNNQMVNSFEELFIKSHSIDMSFDVLLR